MTAFFIAFAVLLVLDVPISISIGASAMLGCIVLDYPLMVIGQKMVTGIDSFLLIAVPLFMLAGNLMNAGKITDKIFNTASELVGWIPGGLGHANVVGSLIFAGMSGSAVADAGGLGTIEVEAMAANGYEKDFAAAVSAASSVIGPTFPPSIPLVIYGSLASVSISKLFMGGVMPAIIMTVLLMVMVYYFAKKRGYECRSFNFKRLVKAFCSSIFALITPIIILLGFTEGWFTPTEASSVAVAYALVVAIFVYKSMTWADFKKCLLDSAKSSANTLLIIGASTLFTYVMVREGASTAMANFIMGLSDKPWVILLTINVILLLMGMVMEPGAILTLMLPVLLPIAKAIGMDLVQFGVVFVLNLMIGQITPPFGVCLFVLSDCNNIKLTSLYKSVLPFIIPLIVTLALTAFVPETVTWLPNLLLK